MGMRNFLYLIQNIMFDFFFKSATQWWTISVGFNSSLIFYLILTIYVRNPDTIANPTTQPPPPYVLPYNHMCCES